MSTSEESWRSVSRTQQFLESLLDPTRTPGVPLTVRQEARRCLHHFPGPRQRALWQAAVETTTLLHRTQMWRQQEVPP